MKSHDDNDNEQNPVLPHGFRQDSHQQNDHLRQLYWKGAGQFVPTQRDATRRMNTFLQLSQKGVSKVSERVRGWRKRAKCAEQSGALQSE